MKNFYLRRLRHFPAQHGLDGTMPDGKPYPPVPVHAAWNICTVDRGVIGCVLRTKWGDRCVPHAFSDSWAGCWHVGSKRTCASFYVRDYYWQEVSGQMPTGATFNDLWLARCAYLDGATVEQAAALARLGAPFLKAFCDGYKAAAAWSSHAPERSRAEFIDGTSAAWSKAASAEAWRRCRLFCQDNAADLRTAEERGRPPDHLGHDLWLTGAGHGAGFWDRAELDEGGLGARLTEACKRQPWRDQSISVYRGKINFD